MTFHYTAWFLGILISWLYKAYDDWVVFHPLATGNNQGLWNMMIRCQPNEAIGR